MKTKNREVARVFAISDAATKGVLHFRTLRVPAALGKSGIRGNKKEGDGATPAGLWPAIMVYYRPDKVRRPATRLPVMLIRPSMGWCDAPGDRNYNRGVPWPYEASAERLWREDRLYDMVVVLNYNIKPRSAGRGSAIFIHAARSGLTPTEGCIALRMEHLIRLVAALTPKTLISAGHGHTPSRIRGRKSGRRYFQKMTYDKVRERRYESRLT